MSLRERNGRTDSVKLYMPPARDNLFLKEMFKSDDLHGRKEDPSWNEMDFKYFRLSLSTMLKDESVAKEYLRSTWEFNPGKSSLPYNQLFRGSYGDTLRSIGGVVEPEIKIKIEF